MYTEVLLTIPYVSLNATIRMAWDGKFLKFRGPFCQIPQKLSQFRGLCVVLESWCDAVNSLLTTRFIPHVRSHRRDMKKFIAVHIRTYSFMYERKQVHDRT